MKPMTFVKKNKMPLAVFGASLVSGYGVAVPTAVGAEMLEEVVVTGRLKEETLQEAPLVVNVLSSEMIDRFRLNNMEDVSYFTPGLTIGEVVTAAGPNISMRGISSPAGSASAAQSVSFVVDGVAINHGIIGRAAQIDLQQIEVLKGPQTLFFGKSASAGILNYVTNDPSDEAEVSLRVGYESEAEEQYGEVVLSGPLSENLKGRLVARISEMDGYIDTSATENPAFGGLAPGSSNDMAPNYERTYVRGTLLWDPSDTISMRTKIGIEDTDNSGAAVGQYSDCVQGTSSLIDLGGGFAFPQLDDCNADDRAPAHAPSVAAAEYLGVKAENYGKNEQTLISHEMRFDVGEAYEITSITAYFAVDDFTVNSFAPGATASFNVAAVTNDQRTISQELRVQTSFDGPVNYTAGVYWADTKFESETAIFAPGLLPLEPLREVNTDTFSIYAQMSYDLSDTMTLAMGGRYSSEDKDYSAFDDGRELVFLDPNNNSRDYSDFSPEVTLSWEATDDTNMFLSYKEGFKSGGFNVGLIPLFDSVVAEAIGLPAESNVSYNQETASGFELGSKSELMDGRLRLNAALFRYEYDNLQAVVFQPATRSLSYRNAGELITQGFDLDLTYLPESVEGLRLNAAMSYADAEYSSEFLFQCYSGQSTNECYDRGNGAPEQDFNGKPPTLAPDLDATFGFIFDMGVANGLNLELNGLAGYTASQYSQSALDPRSLEDSFWRLNAGAKLSASDDSWSVSLIGRNLTDEMPCLSTGAVTAQTATPEDLFCTVNRGRQVWLEGRYNF